METDFNLSHPASHSVNDGVPRFLFNLKYATVDDAINQILDTGPKILLAKVEIKHTFVYSLSPLLIAIYLLWNESTLPFQA